MQGGRCCWLHGGDGRDDVCGPGQGSLPGLLLLFFASELQPACNGSRSSQPRLSQPQPQIENRDREARKMSCCPAPSLPAPAGRRPVQAVHRQGCSGGPHAHSGAGQPCQVERASHRPAIAVRLLPIASQACKVLHGWWAAGQRQREQQGVQREKGGAVLQKRQTGDLISRGSDRVYNATCSGEKRAARASIGVRCFLVVQSAGRRQGETRPATR